MDERIFPVKGTAYAKACRKETGGAEVVRDWWVELQGSGFGGEGGWWQRKNGPCSRTEELGLWPTGSVQSWHMATSVS